MRRNVWTLFLGLMLTGLLTSCEKASSSIVVTPALFEYAPQVQERAADELDLLGPECARTVVVANCSAVKTFMLDYGVVREQIREAKRK